MRLTLAFVFLSSLTMGENFDINVPQKKEENKLLSEELLKDEEAPSDVSTEIIKLDDKSPGMGLRGSYFTDGSALQHVDQLHRVTGIKFRPVKPGSIGAQNTCNILTQQKFFKKAGIHNQVRIGPLTFSKTFLGQKVDVEANAVGEERVNNPDVLTKKTASKPLKLVPTKRKVFVHKKCKQGLCGLRVRTEGVAYKGEGQVSVSFAKKQERVQIIVYSVGTKQLTMICYNANGKIVGERSGGKINGNGETRLLVDNPTKNIKGCTIHSIGIKEHFLRKSGITSVVLGDCFD